MTDNNNEDKRDRFDDFGEEVGGYISLEQASVTAINHARNNTDFYGESYTGNQLTWEVLSTEEGEDYYFVRLSWRPAGRFRGEAGVEQYTIDKVLDDTGSIVVVDRQLIDEPDKPRRNPLRIPSWFSKKKFVYALAGVALVAAVVLIGSFFDRNRDPANPQPRPSPTITRTPPQRTPTPVSGAAPADKPTIVFSGESYETMRVNNAIASFVIVHGYEYPVDTIDTTAKEMQELIANGEIDIEMEAWQHNRLAWYLPAIENKEIENLGLTYESSPQYFVIPQQMADEHNIRTIEDMKDYWQLVNDPKDLSRGLFMTCPTGSGCSGVNSVKLEAYGLDKLYNLIVPDNFDDLEERLKSAMLAGQPIFSYYWEPAKLNKAYDWYILEEPAYDEKCWEQVRLASEDVIPRPIDAACEYPSVPIEKIVHHGLREKAPEIVEMITQMNIGFDPLAEVIHWAWENNVTDAEQIAIRYLEDNADRYREWMPDENYQKVQRQVRERRGY